MLLHVCVSHVSFKVANRLYACFFLQNSKLSTKDKKDSPLFDFLTQIFRGSLRSPLKESNMSLYLSIDHPQVTHETSLFQYGLQSFLGYLATTTSFVSFDPQP